MITSKEKCQRSKGLDDSNNVINILTTCLKNFLNKLTENIATWLWPA